MTTVLDIDALLESPLADLHALAGELDIEGYRLLRKADLTIAILESRGAVADEIRPKVEAKAADLAAKRAERERIAAEREEAEEAAREAAAQERRERSAERAPRGDRQRGQRGGRGRGGRTGERRPGDRAERGGEGRQGDRHQGERQQRRRQPAAADAKADPKAEPKTESKAPPVPEPTVAISGVFEPGSGGGGRLRTDLSRRVRGDADVQRGEVRKWRLHRGDVISGEARKVKRGRTDFQLASITSVNGQNAEQRAASKVRFAEADAAEPGTQYAKRTFKHAPVLAGSRVVITGPTRAAAAQMADKLAAELASAGVVTALVVTVARPQGVAAQGFDLIANEDGKSAEDILPALELVLERGKRIAEGGGDAALVIDGLDLLPAEKAAEILAGSRNLAQHGSLTVIGSAGAGSALEAQATSIAVVSGGRRLKLDRKASWSAHK